jgi:hypothetical protein
VGLPGLYKESFSFRDFYDQTLVVYCNIKLIEEGKFVTGCGVRIKKVTHIRSSAAWMGYFYLIYYSRDFFLLSHKVQDTTNLCRKYLKKAGMEKVKYE